MMNEEQLQRFTWMIESYEVRDVAAVEDNVYAFLRGDDMSITACGEVAA